MKKTILFLCPHHAAKSVLAAAYFQQLADEYGLDYQADSAGTEPESCVMPAVAERLAAEGMDVSDLVPRLVRREDLEMAERVISMGCQVDSLAPAGTVIEYWDDVPMVSQDFEAAVTLIRQRVEEVIEELGRLDQAAEIVAVENLWCIDSA